ncbi:MAG: nuclear transport factor 2 family protein [Oscillatoriales cyanobacterium SM2_1_8]|nr:nuclear transport factor 2 family protein [Oscillatoriales cyanobacterium SM2_1_8]
MSNALLEKVETMVGALTANDWERAKTFYAADMLYRVGSGEPMYGPQAAVDFLSNFYQTVTPADHELRGAWQMDDRTVVVEMDARYNRVADGKKISVACCDVYRFNEAGLIAEWRVYPDITPVFQA